MAGQLDPPVCAGCGRRGSLTNGPLVATRYDRERRPVFTHIQCAAAEAYAAEQLAQLQDQESSP